MHFDDGPSLKRRYNQVGIMADYALSKRSDVYIQAVYQRNTGDVTGTYLDSAYIAGAANVSSNENQTLAQIGLRHRF